MPAADRARGLCVATGQLSTECRIGDVSERSSFRYVRHGHFFFIRTVTLAVSPLYRAARELPWSPSPPLLAAK